MKKKKLTVILLFLDIPDEHFSLPLSPAESDKSNDRKEEDLLIPMKQKRIIRGCKFD